MGLEQYDEESVNDHSGGSLEGEAFLIPVDQLPDTTSIRCMAG